VIANVTIRKTVKPINCVCVYIQLSHIGKSTRITTLSLWTGPEGWVIFETKFQAVLERGDRLDL
jgi:hypothetical protein